MLQRLCALVLGLLGLALLVSTAPLYTWFSSMLPPEDNLSALMSFLLLLALGGVVLLRVAWQIVRRRP